MSKRNCHFDVIVTNWIAATELLYRKKDGDLLTSFERFRTQSLWPCLTTELPESESYLVFPIIRLGLFNSSTISSLFHFCWSMYTINMIIIIVYRCDICKSKSLQITGSHTGELMRFFIVEYPVIPSI